MTATGVVLGHATPRVATPTVPAAGTRAGDLVRVAELLGTPLLPWQRVAAARACVVGDDGRFRHRTVVVVVARQNGKTELARVRVLTGLLLWGERLWLVTAQHRDVALESLRAMVAALEATPATAALIRDVRMVNGQEELVLVNGGRVRVVASTAKAARGFTADGVLADEARHLTDPAAWGALAHTTSARPNAQVWAVSNAGDRTSVVLNGLRDAALSATEPGPLCYLEWSAPDGVDLDAVTDKDLAAANPALGHTVTLEAVRARLVDPPDVVSTELLCRAVDLTASPWPAGSWSAALDADTVAATFADEHAAEPVWLAVDVTPDRRHASLVAARRTADGRSAVRLLLTWTVEGAGSVDKVRVAGEVAREWRRLGCSTPVLFDRWTAGDVAARLEAAGIATEDVSGRAFAVACDDTLDVMTSGRLAHAGQDELTRSVAGCARKSSADGGWRIVRRDSAGPVDAACAMVAALSRTVHPPSTPTVAWG